MPAPALDCLAHPPEKLVTFVTKIVEEHTHYQGPERRGCPRVSVSIPISMQPLGGDFQPLGEPRVALTKNLSGGGIGILYGAKVTAKYLKVTLMSESGEQLDVLAEVRHCTPLGDAFEIGGRFVVDWSTREQENGEPVG